MALMPDPMMTNAVCSAVACNRPRAALCPWRMSIRPICSSNWISLSRASSSFLLYGCTNIPGSRLVPSEKAETRSTMKKVGPGRWASDVWGPLRVPMISRLAWSLVIPAHTSPPGIFPKAGPCSTVLCGILLFREKYSIRPSSCL